MAQEIRPLPQTLEITSEDRIVDRPQDQSATDPYLSRTFSASRLNARAPEFVPRAATPPVAAANRVKIHHQHHPHHHHHQKPVVHVVYHPPPPPPPVSPQFVVPAVGHAMYHPHHEYYGAGIGEHDADLDQDSLQIHGLSEDITHKITKQVEYYFSDANLATTELLMRFIAKDPEGFVPITVIASFKKIKALVHNNSLLADALRTSMKLVVSEDGKKVRRQQPFTESDVEELQSRIVVAENLPEDHCYQSLMKVFSAVGSVKTIRTCYPQTPNGTSSATNRSSKMDMLFANKLHAFVEFVTVEDAEKAVAELIYNYTSGFIHHCTLKKLKHDTKYYYEVGIGHTSRKFWFITPPEVGPDVPYSFGLIGDLGQSYDSNKTLTHYENNPLKGQTLLFVGDLSYADTYPNNDNVRWDTWGRFVERSTAYQPWIWTAGNHEIDFAPEIGEIEPFKPYSHRYHVPYKASGSTSPFWYSIKRASAHIIVLASYSAYGKYTPQYTWLQSELPKVNRTETPWLIILMHSPWYNSYNYHYMEGESMRVMFESWFVNYKVDVVFAGHVHAYERSERISNVAYNIVNGECVPVHDQSAPVYITIGDGGNLEGLALNMTEPQPKYSAYREASFGHAILDIKNRTHAYYSWNRNQDGYATEADSMWFYNRFWHAVAEPVSSSS